MLLATPKRVLSPAATRGIHDRRHWLARNRYQLIGGALIGIALPAAVRSGFDLSMFDPGNFDNTIVGTLAAMLFGAYLTRRMTAYPGVGTISAVLPAFTASYGTMMLAFFFARLDYSRFLFLASFLLVVAWFGYLGLIEPRIRRPRLLLLPFGEAKTLTGNERADWLVARSADEVPEGATGVVADLRADLTPGWEQLLSRAALSGLPVYHWKQVAESLSGTVNIEHISENNLGSLLPSSVYVRFKHLLDVAVALAALPLVLAVLLPAAAVVVAVDGRPILFRQQRIGFRGRSFTMLKLRTMRRDGEPGAAFTEADDPRVTRLGRVLRRYRIDELPQIVNILRGEMSWIGPRPESAELAEWYQREVPFYSYRHIVRPGVTGWAQIHQGNVAKIRAATGKLRYDFYYIKYFSPWLDLLIAGKTVRIVLTGFGAR